MAFTVQIGMSQKRRTDLKRPDMSDVITYEAVLKENTSITNPTLIIQLEPSTVDNIAFKNYVQIAVFRRYYWIVQVIAITSTIVEVQCEVDVLASWYSDIMQNKVFAAHLEQGYNPMLSDGRLPRTMYSTVETTRVSCPFTDTVGAFIVTMASDDITGNTGLVEAYAMKKDDIVKLASNIYGSDFLDKFVDLLYSPSQAISSCIYLPIAQDKLANKSGAVNYGQYSAGQYPYAKSELYYLTEIEIPMKYIDPITNTCADYRNCEPFAQYSIWLPGCGLVQIPMASLIEEARGTSVSIYVEASISVTTGDVNYNICDYSLRRVVSARGSIGVNIPVPNYSSGMADALNGVVQLASSVIAGMAIPPYAPFAIGQGISATTHIILGANQESFSASGTVSGYQSANYLDNYMVYRRNYEISDDPNNSKEIIGRPAYKSLELQGTHGYVQTIGANILTGFSGATATEQELELIDQLLDGGVYVG